MFRFWRKSVILSAVFLLLFQTAVLAASAGISLSGVRYHNGSQYDRIVFDLDKIPNYNLRVEKDGKRIVLEFDNVGQVSNMSKPKISSDLIRKLKYEEKKGKLRVIVSFYDLFISQDLNNLSVLARVIIKYENLFGKIKYKYYLGNLAKKLNELLTKEELVSTSLEKANDSGTFSCFIFDRVNDMLTPLCSNFIYEGLIDEYFGINLNTAKVPSNILGKKLGEKNKDEKTKLDLSKNEKFYTQIKDYNFNKIKIFLNNRLKEHNKMLEESKENNNLKQIRENLLKIKLIKEERPSLINQINLADHISKSKKLPREQLFLFYEQSLLLGETPSTFFEAIDDELAKKGDLYNIIRILSIYSLINGGIKYKIYDSFRKDIINMYGFQELFFLNNLEKLKILKYYESSNIFYYDLNKKLKLINDSVDLNNPNDTSYSFSGYCPIFIR